MLKKLLRKLEIIFHPKTPIFCRISAIDGLENGWTIEDSVKLAEILKNVGIDVIDCSSGGIIGRPRFAVNDHGDQLNKNTDRGLGFQVPLADEIKRRLILVLWLLV